MLVPVILSDSTATISWEGMDNDNGSGIYTYNVFVKTGDEHFSPFLSNTNLEEFEFAYQKDVEYAFYVTATDSANNAEIKNEAMETKLFVTTEIENILIDNTITISPNPTTGIVNVISEQPYSISIYDATGKLIEQRTEQNTKHMINLSNQKIGVYTIKLSNNQGVVVKMVVKK